MQLKVLDKETSHDAKEPLPPGGSGWLNGKCCDALFN
jgi:hypothetical protein